MAEIPFVLQMARVSNFDQGCQDVHTGAVADTHATA